MLTALLQRLGLGRHEPLGKAPIRNRVMTAEQLVAALETDAALQQKLKDIR